MKIKSLTPKISVGIAILAATCAAAYFVPDTDSDGYDDLVDECPYDPAI